MVLDSAAWTASFPIAIFIEMFTLLYQIDNAQQIGYKVKINLFKTTIIISVLTSWIISLSATASDFPPLDTIAEKLAFLIGVHKKVPELFSNADTYETDLFELLDEQKKLLMLLNTHEYKELFSNKNYISLEITPPEEFFIGEVQINPVAVEAWKQALKDVLAQVKDKYLNPEELLNSIYNDVARWEKFQDKPLEIFHTIGRIPEGKGQREIIRNLKEPLSVLNVCKKKSSLAEQYGCVLKNYDQLIKLPNLPSIEKIKDLILSIHELEKLILNIKLALVIKRSEAATTVSSWDVLESKINQLKQEDLIFFSDKNDVVIPEVSKMMLLALENPIVKNLSNEFSKWIDFYANQTISRPKKLSGKILLEEVPPQVGIFRGFIGSDCSTRFSFPYPNDPHERVFLIKSIKNKKEILKGYVSAIEVLVNNKKALYVITISGSTVSSADTELILRGLEKAKNLLGLSRIILPDEKKLDALINFPPIKAVYAKHLKNGELVSLCYQDFDIRKKIELFKSKFNNRFYDYALLNDEGVSFFLENNSFVVKEISRGNLVTNNLLDEYKKEDIFDFLVTIRNSKKMSQMLNVLEDREIKNYLGADYYSAIEDFLKTVDSCSIDSEHAVSVAQYKNALAHKISKLGIKQDYLKIKPSLMMPGYLFCVDAFSLENAEEAAALSADLFIEDSNAAISKLIDNNIDSLKHTKAFCSLNNKFLKELESNFAIDRHRVIKIFRRLKPADSKVHFAFADVLKNDETSLIRINAAQALGDFKPKNIQIHWALAEALRDKDSGVRTSAAEALGSIKPKALEIQKMLAEALRDEDKSVRCAAAKAVGEIKPEDSSIHMMLANALNDEEEVVRFVAANALAEIKPVNFEVLLTIVKDFLESTAPSLRSQVLEQIKPEDFTLQFMLVDGLKGKNFFYVYKILRAIKPANPDIHMAIIEVLKTEKRKVVYKMLTNLMREIETKYK